MIMITIERATIDRRILSFVVEGHAKFAKPGKDIVCAGVSAVTVGTVNAIEQLTGLELPATMKSGWLRSDIPQHSDAVVASNVQLLLESMIVMLHTIADSYGKYVEVREQFRS